MVHDLKKIYPAVESVLVLPYPDRKADSALYDSTVYPPLENVPKRFAVSKRNRWIVESADILVAFVEHDWGGAAKTLGYAKKKNLRVINLAASAETAPR